MNLKLGRHHATKAKLQIKTYLGPALPPPPGQCDWSVAMTQDWGAMKNAGAGAVGDCTVAAMGHGVQTITANSDGLITPTDDEILNMYRGSGYDPADPNSDQGWTFTGVSKAMCDFGLAGVKLDAFADVDVGNLTEVRQTISLCGGAWIGVQLTQDDIDAFQAGQPWTATKLQDVLGGHALWVPAYDDLWMYPITWGKKQPASWDWFEHKCDEAHACIFFPWVQNTVGSDPDGWNQAQLEADLQAL